MDLIINIDITIKNSNKFDIARRFFKLYSSILALLKLKFYGFEIGFEIGFKIRFEIRYEAAMTKWRPKKGQLLPVLFTKKVSPKKFEVRVTQNLYLSLLTAFNFE